MAQSMQSYKIFFAPQEDLNCGPLELKASALPMSYDDSWGKIHQG